jgi:hypothetical protein
MLLCEAHSLIGCQVKKCEEQAKEFKETENQQLQEITQLKQDLANAEKLRDESAEHVNSLRQQVCIFTLPYSWGCTLAERVRYERTHMSVPSGAYHHCAHSLMGAPLNERGSSTRVTMSAHDVG